MQPPSGSFPSQTATLSGDDLVLRRPQFVRKGTALFFLESRRPFSTLAVSDCAVWDALEGGASVAALRARFGAEVEDGIRRLLGAAVCDVASPPAKGRRRVVVIEPHIDDAALSVGGTIWQLRDRCEFTVVTIASRSNFTSYFELDRSYFEVERVSALRKAEGDLFARLTGGQHLALGHNEATLRYRDDDWTLEWFRRHRHSVSAFIARRSGEAELRRWTDAVRAALRDIRSDELWMPLGVGAHTDHELARNACLRALLEEPALAEGRELRFYQEVPYGAHDPGYTPRLVRTLEQAGASLAAEPVRIDGAFEAKLRLLTVFGSQFKLEALRPGIEECARLASGGVGRSELLWRVERLPRIVDPLSLYVDAPVIEKVAASLSRWSRRHRHAARMRVLLLVPPGRWAEDLEVLLREFPDAALEVFASDGSAAEVADHPSPRVKLRQVVADPRAWALLSVQLAVSPPVPTVFAAGLKRLALAHRLSWLWPRSDPLVFPSLGHFVAALQRVASA
jgi:LmbE family N-acetylglucosaminyl deacetylase